MTPHFYRSLSAEYILRISIVSLFMVVVNPAWAGPQERANTLFVEAAKLTQAAIIEPNVEVRLEQLMEAQEGFQRIIEEYPSSNLAVKLISGQSIGDYSLESMRVTVEWAYGEAQEERARIAASEAEKLLSQMAETQTLEKGKPLAEKITILIAQLEPDYGATSFLSDLRSRFEDQYGISFNTWARTAAEPIELLLTELRAASSAEEAEPLVETIENNLKELSTFFGQALDYIYLRFESVQSVLPEKWATPMAEEILELVIELETTRTEEGGDPIISKIQKKIDQLSAKFGSTNTFSQTKARFQYVLKRQPNAWLAIEIAAVDSLITSFSKSKSIEGTTQVVDAINQLVVKHGWSYPLYALNSRFKDALSNTGYRQSVMKKIKRS